MNIRAILIDDELPNLDNLGAMLAAHCPEVEITATARNAADGARLITLHRPDLLFLDIQMPGKNGFDLLRELPDRDVEVIFVTAYDQHGIQAIKFSAIDYLLKPVNSAELKEAVNKAVIRLDHKQKNRQLENLLALIDGRRDRNSHRIALPSQKDTRFVPVRDIVRCESSNNYTTFYLLTGEEILVSRAIYEYEELLVDYGFVRCHQSHLVNLDHVLSLVKEDNGYLLMEGGRKVPLSRQKRDGIKKRLGI
ncbi:LytR/AlgR family response regulator transcription factor [Hufsiella ginkgonis]|uniref:Response regulator n=1 Tax=Hufsiella ginkgonis TaxID=2695274 RepID=A0A7K1XW83_9SPHI|nr:LytTR family DNA-binding domain-containing protein [Hufsiella ginkgonis]MXV15039.1 response regulator [Hufsiella ginkgonis]